MSFFSVNFGFPDLDTAFLSTPSPERNNSTYPLLKNNLKSSLDNQNAVVQPNVSSSLINRDLKPKVQNNLTISKKEDTTNSQHDITNSISSNKMNNRTPLNSQATSINQQPSSGTISGDWTSTLPDSENEDSNNSLTTKESFSTIPSRTLKPQDHFNNLKDKKKDLDEEQMLLEQSFKAEKVIIFLRFTKTVIIV